MRSAARSAGGRRLLADDDDTVPANYHLMGYVSRRLMVHTDYIQVILNGTVVHQSDPSTWHTEAQSCPLSAR